MRAFVPAGGSVRPYHRAMDTHYQSVKQPSKALAAAQAFGGAGPETWVPKQSPKSHHDTHQAIEERNKSKTHHRASPSRPDDLAWQSSPFRAMLLEPPARTGGVSPRRPFCPAGANVRPVHAALDQHVVHVARLQESSRGRKAVKKSVFSRQRENTANLLDDPPAPLDSPIGVSGGVPQFGTSPPMSPGSEAPTVGGQGWRGQDFSVESRGRDQQSMDYGGAERSTDTAGAGLGFADESGAAITGGRDRRSSNERRSHDALKDLAEAIAYDGVLSPVRKMLGGPNEEQSTSLGRRVL